MPASALMNVMIAAARKAGRGLARDFGEVEQLQVSVKGPANFVSAADHRSEETLFRELTRARPGYCFLMEERGAVEGADKTHRWIVDPLDGTTNFLHGNPLFAIAIALERQGELVAGLIYNPILDEMYTAEKGQGAFVNSRRLGWRHASPWPTASWPSASRTGAAMATPRFLSECKLLMTQVAGIRRTGSAATDLSWVAAGRLDGYLDYSLGAWDIAAGALLVREAGGHVTDSKGDHKMYETKSIVAGNATIHKALLGVVAEAQNAS